MNWEAIGVIGEILGAGAIVLSLVYLASKIRYARKQSEMESLRHTWGEINQICDKLSESKELQSSIVAGSPWIPPDQDEYSMFEHFHLRLLNNPRSLGTCNLVGPFLNGQIENLGEIVRGYFDHPGTRQMWENRRSYFRERLSVYR